MVWFFYYEVIIFIILIFECLGVDLYIGNVIKGVLGFNVLNFVYVLGMVWF